MTDKRPQCTSKIDGHRCKLEASWNICLDFQENRQGRIRRVPTPIWLCNRHRCATSLDMVLTDNLWRSLRRQLRSAFGMKPRRNLVRLAWEHFVFDVPKRKDRLLAPRKIHAPT